MMTLHEVAGFFGVTLYLGAYLALQLGFLKGSGYAFATINMIAAAFILVSLTVDFNFWSAVIQVSWISISIVGMTRYFLKTRQIKFTSEEQSLVDAKLSQMTRLDARSFLSAGSFIEVEEGTEIARQGEVIGKLFYLASGIAHIEFDGKKIGQVDAKNFVGELTCFNGGPASASVTLGQRSKLFSIDTSVLNALCAKNPDLRLQLEVSLKLDTHQKITASNERLRILEARDG